MRTSSVAWILAMAACGGIPAAKAGVRLSSSAKPVYFDRFDGTGAAADLSGFATTLLRLRLAAERDLKVVQSPTDAICEAESTANPTSQRQTVSSLPRKHFVIIGSLRLGVNSQFLLQYSVHQVQDCRQKSVTIDEGTRQFTTADALMELNVFADRIAGKLAEAASDRLGIRIETTDDKIKRDLDLAFNDSDTFRPVSSSEAKYVVRPRKNAQNLLFEIAGPDVRDVGEFPLGGKKYTAAAFADVDGAEYIVRHAENLEARRRIGVTGPLEKWKTGDLIEKARSASDPKAVAAVLEGRRDLNAQGELLLADSLGALDRSESAAEAYDRAIPKLDAGERRSAMIKSAAAWEAANKTLVAHTRWRSVAEMERSAGGLTAETAIHLSTVAGEKKEAWTSLLEAARTRGGEQIVHTAWETLMLQSSMKPGDLAEACQASKSQGSRGLLGICEHAEARARWAEQDHAGASAFYRSAKDDVLASGPWAESIAADYGVELGWALRNPQTRKEAIAAAREALALRIRTLGAEHETTGDSFYQLGVVLTDDRQYEEGSVNLEKALAIRSRSKAQASDLGLAENWLAYALEKQGGSEKLKAAELHYRAALAAFKASGEGAKTASTHMSLGLMLDEQARWDESEAEFREALKLYSERDPKGEDAATAMLRLANALAEEGAFDEAVSFARKGLEIRKNAPQDLGPLSAAHLELVSVYLYSGAHADSLAEAKESLRLRMMLPRTVGLGAVEVYSVALSEEYLGKLTDAERDYGEAVKRDKAVFGEDSVEASYDQIRLAHVLILRGKYREAGSVLERTAPGVKRYYPIPSIRYTIAEGVEAELRLATGDREEAYRLAKDALDIREQHENGSKWRHTTSLLRAGRILLAQHREAEAAVDFNRVKEIWIGLKRPDHPDVATAEWGLGVAAGAAGRLDEMETRCKRSLEVAGSPGAPSPLSISAAHECLADAAARSERLDTAVIEQRLAIDTFAGAVARAHPRTAGLLDRLADLLELKGETSKAAEERAKSQKVREEHVLLEKSN